MVAFNFSPEFAPKVASGEKTQTIRSTRRGKPGDMAQLLTGQRTKRCARLMFPDPELVLVDYVAIRPDYLTFGNKAKHPSDIDECARMDGFANYAAMVAWFQEKYRCHSYVGFLHRWALPTNFVQTVWI